MEYIPNTLAEVVTYNLNEESALTLVHNLLLCLKYIHSANVVHRDLKPENILITSDCTVKICDFGFARSIRAVSSKSVEQRKQRDMSPCAFTRFYRPPEVILCRKDYDE
jgi:mitogen-activated protein kinase 1/3